MILNHEWTPPEADAATHENAIASVGCAYGPYSPRQIGR